MSSLALVVAALCALLLVPALAGAATAPAQTAKHKTTKKKKAKKVTVKVSVVSTSQKTVLAGGKLKVKVTATGKVATKVSIKNGSSSVVKTTKLTFKKKGSRTLSIKLSSTGKKKLAVCGTPKVTVHVTYGKHTAKATRTLSKDSSKCPVIVPPPPGPKPTGGCDTADGIDNTYCLLPWPNDYYTKADASTVTGRRLNLQTNQMIWNKAAQGSPAVPADPTPYNRSDGFSGNSAILAQINGLDSPAALANSKIAPIYDMGAYSAADAGLVVIATNGPHAGQRAPIWSEVDSNATTPGNTLVLTRGSKVLDEGTHYIVAFRNLKNGSGAPIPATGLFKQYRDGTVPATASQAVKDRAAHMNQLFNSLAAAGIARSSLNLAWDFTTASQKSLSGPVLKMRDESFAALGDADTGDRKIAGIAPTVTVKPYAADTPAHDTSHEYTTSESHYVLRRVEGTIKVPCYMGNTTFKGQTTSYCGPGTTINYGADGLPKQAVDAHGTPQYYNAPFTCIVPRAGYDSPNMATGKRAILFGHGLLGDATTVESVKNRAGVMEGVICGTDWIGMSKNDITTVISALPNLKNFPSIAERSEQSLLDFLYLGRWMASQDTNPAHPGMNYTPQFEPTGTTPTAGNTLMEVPADPADTRIFNLGGSQGGIMGGALTALAPDFDRSLLDVPAVGYSTLLNRSEASVVFKPALAIGYPNPAVGQIALSLIQTIWDRGEGGGYVHHITTDTLPKTPPHKILILEAFGDHLVSNVQTEVEARTVGAVLRAPTCSRTATMPTACALNPDRWYDPSDPTNINRSTDRVPFWGLDTVNASAFTSEGNLGGVGADGFDSPTSAAIIPIDIGPLRPNGPTNWSGVTPEPPRNTWPVATANGNANNGQDPHADVATSQRVLTLLFTFLRSSGGVIADQGTPNGLDSENDGKNGCGVDPCYAEGWQGTP